MTKDEFVQWALALPSGERVELALQLLQSVDPEASLDPDVVNAWGEEARRRLEMYKRGEAELEDWETVYQNAKARLA